MRLALRCRIISAIIVMVIKLVQYTTTHHDTTPLQDSLQAVNCDLEVITCRNC